MCQSYHQTSRGLLFWDTVCNCLMNENKIALKFVIFVFEMSVFLRSERNTDGTGQKDKDKAEHNVSVAA